MAGVNYIAIPAGLGVICIALAGGGLLLIRDQLRIGRRLRDIEPVPVGLQASGRRLTSFGTLTIPGKDREEVQHGLHAAGFYEPKAELVFGAVRAASSLLTAGLVFGLLALKGQTPAPLLLMAPAGAAMIVFLLSKAMLASLAGRRLRAINAELPFTLDALQMMLESGVSLDQSLRTFAQSEGRGAPTVSRTVAFLVEDLQRGMAFDLALSRWAERLGMPGARELAAVFRQSLNHGAEMGGALKQFATEFSERRVSTAREAIGKTTVRMTMVMMLFLMPALFLLIAGPAVTQVISLLKQLHS